jgi:hypothetical protein
VRTVGDQNNVLWDGEAMLQLGSWANQDKLAASCVGGLGYRFADVPTTPQVWLYYDWASGESHPGEGGTNHTFNQLYPFGHYYFGFLDLVGRQNIRDVHAQVACFPAPWITALAQWHRFHLDSSRDALYSASGAVLRQDRTGLAGHDVGNELDFILSFQLGAHSNLLFGWSKLYSGEFIQRTGPNTSPELLYMQYSFRW